MKNKIIALVIALICLVIVAVSFTQTKTGDIKIGVLLPLTGGLASYGEPAKETVDLLVNQINNSGGISGRKVLVEYGDHKCDPKTMVSEYQRLFSVNGVKYFNSVGCSGTVSAVLDLLSKNNTPLVSAAISATKLSGANKNFFRNWSNDYSEASILANQIIKSNYKKVAVLNEETDYAKGLRDNIVELVNGKTELVSESFTSGATDVRSQITKIKNSKPEILIISAQTVTSGEVVLTQLEQLGYYPKLMVNFNILKASALVEKHKKILEGAIGADYVLSKSEKLDTFLADYKKVYGKDCPQVNICAMEYDAVNALIETVAKNNSSKSMIDYLESNTFNGVTGSIKFDDKHNRSGAEYSPFRIVSGKLVPVN